MPQLRFATFNVENLFSRPKILGLKDNDRIADLLEKLAEFKRLLDLESYSGLKPRLLELHNELAAYVEINLRSSKVGRSIITTEKVIAKGRGDWEGFVDLKRDEFRGLQVENTGRVIKTVKPQIMGFVEVENRAALRRFNADILNRRFRDLLVVDGNDMRGIDVAVASAKDYPITGVRTNIFARDSQGEVFSRDCLEVTVDVGLDRPLHVLQNHFKAKDRTPAKSDAKRKRQSEKVREILTERYDLDRDLVIVAGDLNDQPGSAPMAPLLETPGLFDVNDLANRPPAERWTYYYWSRRQFNTIDYVLVSKALKSRVAGSGIERRGIADLHTITSGAQSSFPEVDSWRVSASDHAAFWLDIDL